MGASSSTIRETEDRAWQDQIYEEEEQVLQSNGDDEEFSISVTPNVAEKMFGNPPPYQPRQSPRRAEEPPYPPQQQQYGGGYGRHQPPSPLPPKQQLDLAPFQQQMEKKLREVKQHFYDVRREQENREAEQIYKMEEFMDRLADNYKIQRGLDMGCEEEKEQCLRCYQTNKDPLACAAAVQALERCSALTKQRFKQAFEQREAELQQERAR
ncbi:hypothetical protein QOT17_023672 [Balamuthia mandrillaris]